MTSLPRSDGLGRFPSDMAVLDHYPLPTYIKISHSLTYVIIFSREIRNSIKSNSPTLQSIIRNKITTRNHQIIFFQQTIHYAYSNVSLSVLSFAACSFFFENRVIYTMQTIARTPSSINNNTYIGPKSWLSIHP